MTIGPGYAFFFGFFFSFFIEVPLLISTPFAPVSAGRQRG